MTIERFPGAAKLLARVRAHVARRDMLRDLYLNSVPSLFGDDSLSRMWDTLHERFTDWLKRPEGERETPFPMLSRRIELGVLELFIRQVIESGRLTVFEERPGATITAWAMNVIRVKQVTGSNVCAGKFFRDTVTAMTAEAIPTVLGDVAPEDTAVVTILRAALPMAVAYHQAGVRTFGVVAASRGHASLRPTIAYKRLPPEITQKKRVVVVDPAFATAGSVMATIELLHEMGVPLDRIVVHTVDVAPEGVLIFRHAFPEIHIVTHSRSNQLNEVGYLIDVGVNDAGDLAMADITNDMSHDEWVVSGILTGTEAADVVRRSVPPAA